MTVRITVTGNQFAVFSDYHPEIPPAARKLNGNWDGGGWVFDNRDRERVLELYRSVYGYDPANSEAVVDIRVTVPADSLLYAECDGLYLAGRMIGRATDRDSGAKQGEGIVFLEGHVTSGGSRKNWTTRIEGPAVFEIRDVYVLAAENIKNMYGWIGCLSYEVIHKEPEKNQCQRIADEIAEKAGFASQERVPVSILLAALTRVEFSEDITVPKDMAGDPLVMDALVDQCYAAVDGGDYSDDADYWERSPSCRYETD